MKKFWICGPFKEVEDRMERAAFKMEQMRIFLDLLEEDKRNQKLLSSDSIDEILLAKVVQADIDKRLNILLGIPNDDEKKDDEISRETILKFIRERTEE